MSRIIRNLKNGPGYQALSEPDLDDFYVKASSEYYRSNDAAHWSIIRVPFRNLARATVSLPLGGFVFCVIWAMFTDLESATYTHCGVRISLKCFFLLLGIEMTIGNCNF